EQPGRTGDGARNRAGGVLVRSDRHDPVTADESKRRFDANIHVLPGRTQDRPGRLGPHTHGGEVRAHRDSRPRAGAAGREHRAAVVERGIRPRIDAGVVRVEAVAHLRQVGAWDLEELTKVGYGFNPYDPRIDPRTNAP